MGIRLETWNTDLTIDIIPGLANYWTNYLPHFMNLVPKYDVPLTFIYDSNVDLADDCICDLTLTGNIDLIYDLILV